MQVIGREMGGLYAMFRQIPSRFLGRKEPNLQLHSIGFTEVIVAVLLPIFSYLSQQLATKIKDNILYIIVNKKYNIYIRTS